MNYKHDAICTNCGNEIGLNWKSGQSVLCPFCRQPTVEYQKPKIIAVPAIGTVKPKRSVYSSTPIPTTAPAQASASVVVRTTRETKLANKMFGIIGEKEDKDTSKTSVNKKRKYVSVGKLINRIPEIFKMHVDEKKTNGSIAGVMKCAPSTIDRIINRRWRLNDHNPKRVEQIKAQYAVVDKTYPGLAYI